MPTPFMHLHMAERMIADPALSADAKTDIQAAWPAFYLGSVVPDFQAISEVKRGATHFYSIPPEKDDYAAFDRMLEKYPSLQKGRAQSSAHAIFIAAYGVHLTFDLLWDHSILTPIFRYGEWGDPFARYNAHNTLLTALDRDALAALGSDGCEILSAVDPRGWLPFGPDADVLAWQKTVAEQLLPGAKIQTVEIYSKRMGLEPEEFAGQLDNPDWMAENIYQYVARDEIQRVLDRSIDLGIDVLKNYLYPN